MLTFTTLASGSLGNAALVSCGDTHILLDAGISAKRLTAGLAELGVKFVACPMTSFCDAEEAKEVAAELNKWGNEAKKYGITIG